MAPKYALESQVKELSGKLQTSLEKLACKWHNIDVIKTLAHHLDAYIADTLLSAPEQGMNKGWRYCQNKG
jgi:hypothetical protein